MTSTKKLHRHAMLATVSPMVLVLSGILAGPAAAVDRVNPAATTLPTGITLADGDSLTNSGTITNNGNPAVGGAANVTFILNTATGVVEAVGDFGIGVNGNLGSFENHGMVSTDTDAAVGIGGDLGTFLNTGTLFSSDNAGFGINGAMGTFTNSGTITGTNGPAAVFNGTTASFDNSGKLTSGTNWTTVFFEDGVAAFTNSGTIVNTGTGKGVEADLDNGAVGSFNNSGTITGGTGERGVGLFGTAFGVTSFANSGTITGMTNASVGIDGKVGSFTNSGTLTGGNWDAVFLGMGVDSFVNTSTGVIQNVDHNGNGGTGVGFNTGTTSGGLVKSFENHGTISGDATAADSAGVGFFDGGDPSAHVVGSFINTGTISGSGNGVSGNGGFGTFTNSGTIAGNLWQGVGTNGNVGTFTNTGTISSIQDYGLGIDGTVESFTNSGTIESKQSRGIRFGGDVTNFTNSGTVDGMDDGVRFNAALGTGSNSGTIISRSAAGPEGIRFNGTVGSFTNSGTIQGEKAIEFANGGNNVLINSGVLRGTGGEAVTFDGGDDLLTLQTGSQIFGAVEFRGGDDTVDVSGFSGSTLLKVFDLENVTPGDKLVYFDQPNDQLAVVEPVGVTQGSQAVSIDMATQLGNLVTPILDGALSGSSGGSVEPLGYMPTAPQTAADLAIIDPVAPAATAWATVIGGGSHDANPVSVSSLYGALIAGTHTMLAADTTVGVLGGVGVGRVDINTGGHTVDSTTGLAGLYGRHTAGVVDIDMSLLAGVAGQQSARQVIGAAGVETARADYASWFVSPSLGVAIPVLQTSDTDLDLVGRVSYVGGQVSGYSETGSSLNLTVGDQAIGLIDARIGLAAEWTADTSGDTVVNASGGLFAQTNVGTTTVPVSFLGQTQNAAVPGGTEIGLYGGLGFASQLNDAVRFTVGADAQWKFSGQLSGAMRAGLSADF